MVAAETLVVERGCLLSSRPTVCGGDPRAVVDALVRPHVADRAEEGNFAERLSQ